MLQQFVESQADGWEPRHRRAEPLLRAGRRARRRPRFRRRRSASLPMTPPCRSASQEVDGGRISDRANARTPDRGTAPRAGERREQSGVRAGAVHRGRPESLSARAIAEATTRCRRWIQAASAAGRGQRIIRRRCGARRRAASRRASSCSSEIAATDRRSSSRRRRSASTATITSARCCGPKGTSTSSISRENRRGRSSERRAEAVAAARTSPACCGRSATRPTPALFAVRVGAPGGVRAASSRGHASGRRGRRPRSSADTFDAADGALFLPAEPVAARRAAAVLHARQGALRVELRAEQPARLGAHPALGHSRPAVMESLFRCPASFGALPADDGVLFRVTLPAARG